MRGSSLRMRDEEYDELRSIVRRGSGVSLPDTKRYIVESRLGRRVRELGMESFGQYAHYLRVAPQRDIEFDTTLRLVTIAETGFFRYPRQLKHFQDIVLPRLIERRRVERRLRIWTPGCAAGQETYSVASLICAALGVRLNDWRVDLLGTDINAGAVDEARRGCYPAASLRQERPEPPGGSVDPLHHRGMFDRDGDELRITDDLRRLASFEVHDLRDYAAARRLGRWDAIFCRNVLGLMAPAAASQVIHTLHDTLECHGTLFVGHLDTDIMLESPFAASTDGCEQAYDKAPAAITAARSAKHEHGSGARDE